jgi:hypothetical protein
MTYTITDTTDGKYLGLTIEVIKDGLVLPENIPEIQIDLVIPIENGLRLINSNYIIDVKEK